MEAALPPRPEGRGTRARNLMGIFFAFLAAVCASMSNLFMRRSIDTGGSSKAYLVVQLTISFMVMILLNPVRTGIFGWNTNVAFLGLLGGILLGVLMWGLGKALEKGPAGLSFAVLNTSSVMPAILLAVLFGPALGHSYTVWNGVGSSLVVLGLFWAGWTSNDNPNKVRWALFALLIFCIHTLFLVFLQWWAMVIDSNVPLSRWVPFHIKVIDTQWFMPVILFVGAFMQWMIYWKTKDRMPFRKEVVYGMLGGVSSGVCTFFLILAPQVALPWESAMIFPIFSVSIIIICNSWARGLYKEQVNWKANIVCLVGLIVGTVTWNAV